MLASLDADVPLREARMCCGPSVIDHITEACLSAALHRSQRGKSPGTDGLPYEFYSKFWVDVVPMSTAALNEAFDSPDGMLTLTQRTGVITLLHKSDEKPADLLDSYRPITLLNCD